MSNSVYRIGVLLDQLLVCVPIGTNLGLAQVLFALMAGRFLLSRGAVFGALWDLLLPAPAVRRAEAALAYGCFDIASLLARWQRVVAAEDRFAPHVYEGYRPVACDLVGFFRPRLRGRVFKHYASEAKRALPALVFALVASVGSVGRMRLPLLRDVLRQQPSDPDETAFLRRALRHAADKLKDDEAIVVDAGAEPKDLLALTTRFVVRAAKNFTARRNVLPAYGGRGRPKEYGDRVRPLGRTYTSPERKHRIRATRPDRTLRVRDRGRRVWLHAFDNLVLADQKPGAASFTCVVVCDPRYKDPLVLISNLPVSPEAIWRLYRDRWPIEQAPLAAKQMLGAERAFAHGRESRFRLPELALLAGNLLAYLAATSNPVPTGFWDRCSRPTCGRLRRSLLRVHFSDLPLPEGRLREKHSVTDHLPKGIAGHRRRAACPLTGN